MQSQSSRRLACIFCRIADGLERNPILYRDDTYTVFRDRRPASTNHLLVITNEHVRDVTCLRGRAEVVDGLVHVATTLLQKEDADLGDVRVGFHVPPMVSVYHIHLHVIWPWSNTQCLVRWKYKRKSTWFWLPETAKAWLRKQDGGDGAAPGRQQQQQQQQQHDQRQERRDSDDQLEGVTRRVAQLSTN
ncbi:histidine triad nucleotide-binding protein 3-like isoform X1 [Pollicipes pollicipes]|uniref:histidine triad nucleotide-binding protein 3-like isoform X1 n=1 Tax=Pollicipes pollicipes TaxID=41117 RepID=UPI001884E2B9|nr:histidine triad nucleotide-binding protein 3-like isoform X1 [Pollicipes pollicipes]